METLVFPRLDICSSSRRRENRYGHLNPVRQLGKANTSWVLSRRNDVGVKFVTAFHGGALPLYRKGKKDSICTADELHYVLVPNSDWRVALWRYLPALHGSARNHPLLLLTGVGSNALGYDLSPESSFARYMSKNGYDTWILEVRGSGLSTNAAEIRENGRNSSVGFQLRKWNQSLIDIIEGAKQLGSLQPINLQGVTSALEEFQEQLDMIVKYNWDFDHYLEEDVPAAMEYIRSQCSPKDGKLQAIGHSMGGILLYAMISRCACDNVDPQLASVVTLCSSLDYRPSNSSLKFLLPLIDPAQALDVPVIPIGPLLVIAHPLASRPPYILGWLRDQISADGMLHPMLLEKLVTNGYETVPAKVLVQLATVFNEGGLRDRNGTFCYKDHLGQTNVPILAVAGDKDLICPPEAVYETVKLIPKQLVSYKVLGNPGGPHFAHYDIVGSPLAAEQLYPLIIDFLNCHDTS